MTINDLWEIGPRSFIFVRFSDGSLVEYTGPKGRPELKDVEVVEISATSYPMYRSVIEVKPCMDDVGLPHGEYVCAACAYESVCIDPGAESARRTIGPELSDAILEELVDLHGSGVMDLFTCEEMVDCAKKRVEKESCEYGWIN